MAPKRSLEPAVSFEKPSDYTRSNHITDRSSKFIGYFSSTMSPSRLQNLPEISSATHKMAAWRLPSKQRTLTQSGRPIVDAGYDEDGEKGSGWRLRQLLQDEDIMGALVVARWYGGVMLGQKRWEHILDVAKEAIKLWKARSTDASSTRSNAPVPASTGLHSPPASQTPPLAGINSTPPRLNAEDIKRQREELVQKLGERDSSIAILRRYLDEKKSKLNSAAPSPSAPSAEPAKSPDYASMPLVRLQAMERARDASIAYLLKELDKADQAQREEEEIDAAFQGLAENPKLADTSGAKNAPTAPDSSQEPPKGPGKRKRNEDAWETEDSADEDAFEEAWKANEVLLTPKKSKGVQVNDDELPPSPLAKRARKLDAG